MPMPKGVAPRWRKVYKGERFYFRGTYADAIAKWEAKKVELDRATTDKGKLTPKELLAMVGTVLHFRAQDQMEEANELVTTAHNSTDEAAQTILDSRRESQQQDNGKTLGQAVEKFLERKKAGVSIGHYGNLARCCNHFAETVGRRLVVKNLGATVVTDYRIALERKMEEGWTKDYASGYGRVVRTFFNWLYETEMIDRLPRNIKELYIKIDDKEIPTFDPQEVTTLLKHSPKRTKLYLLLMLNTGMTQKDISDMTPAQLDLTAGTITRKRSKTKNTSAKVPKVSYPLWKETLTLLKQFAKTTGETVLVNADGGRLWVETYDKGKVDNIRVAYGRLVRSLRAKKILDTKKTLKIFRKTSSSMLEDSPYPQCADYFLGHAPQGVSQKNYKAAPQASMKKAVAWLGQQYGIK